jgi:hypothetical protein
MTPVVFLVSVPVAIVRPDPAKYVWLLLFPAGVVLRRLEPPEVERATTGATSLARPRSRGRRR